jgi:phosphoribosylanthranilate isomerase
LPVLRTRIKFCGFVRASDVDDAVALGVDAIGFVFYPRSPRAIDALLAAALRRRLPSYVSAVGLFVNEDPAIVRQVGAAVGLDVIQFHGDETATQCRESLMPGLPYWRAVRMRSSNDLLESSLRFDDAEAFLLDAFSDAFGGTGTRFDWSWIPTARKAPLILSGGLDEHSVTQAIRQVSPTMVDVSSGIQGSDARCKDSDRMARFVAAVLAEDARRLSESPGSTS